MPESPEQKACCEIDSDLTAAGWLVQDHRDIDLTAGRGIAAREFQIFSGKPVPQDPKDEPAAELLKRIAAEREVRNTSLAGSAKPRGRRSRSAMGGG